MLARQLAPRSVVAALAAAVVALASSCGVVSADDEPGEQQDAGPVGPTGPIDQIPPDPNCNEQTFEPERAADPDIMIVFDRSGSMGDGAPTKYQQTTTAVTNAVTSAA